MKFFCFIGLLSYALRISERFVYSYANYTAENGIVVPVQADDDGQNSIIGRPLNGEYGSRIPIQLIVCLAL
jgi:hypothetical protein